MDSTHLSLQAMDDEPDDASLLTMLFGASGPRRVLWPVLAPLLLVAIGLSALLMAADRGYDPT